MRQTREEIATNMAGWLCWQVARHDDLRLAQRFVSAHGSIASHFRPRRHRLPARAYRQAMTSRFHIRREMTSTAMPA
jgi:hypothetical protein